MDYKDMEKEKYPTDDEFKVMEFIKDSTSNFDDICKGTGFSEDELKIILEDLKRKGFIDKVSGPIPQSFDRKSYVLMETISLIKGLEKKGILKLSLNIIEGSLQKARRHAQEHCWSKPSKNEMDEALLYLFEQDVLQVTSLGIDLVKYLKNNK